MFGILAILSVILAPAGARPSITYSLPKAASEWRIDAVHSEIRFRIRHFVTRVSGTFTDWDGIITGDPADWTGGSVVVNIRAQSVDTRSERRDNDLRSANFFEVEKYPEITFRSTGVRMEGSAITLVGDLTIKNITRAVTLTGSYLGIAPGKEGKDRVGFEVSTTINRLDFGVNWNRAAEGGGMMLGDDVRIEIAIEAVKQVPAGAN
jgi:polyisoprenoid-binding protein YceI